MSLKEDFDQAAIDSRKLRKKPTDEELLDLYGLFKVGQGEDFSKATAPGLFDLKAKYKYKSWKKFVEEDRLTTEQAQEKYIQLVEKLKAAYDFDPNKEPEKTGSS